jgi:hypothetical protein
MVIVPTFALLGALVWFCVAAVGYNAAATIGPSTVEDAMITSLDLESNSTSSDRRNTRWVEGETETGRTFRFASDEAYEAARRDGYPMSVEVTISDWTGSAVALRGDSFDIDRTGLVGGIGWLLATALVAAGALLGTWAIFRKASVLAGLSFVLLSPLWLWLGFIAMRAYRT